jgi:hypothetical protein
MGEHGHQPVLKVAGGCAFDASHAWYAEHEPVHSILGIRRLRAKMLHMLLLIHSQPGLPLLCRASVLATQ